MSEKWNSFFENLDERVCAFRMAKKDFAEKKINSALARVRSDADKLDPDQRKMFQQLLFS